MSLTKKINTTITRSELFDICLNASRVCTCSVMIDTDKAQCLLHLSDTGKAQCLLHLSQHFDQLCNYASCTKTLIHNKKKAIFHCKTEGYNPNQDALHQLVRHQQTIIFRLRTGHCRLNSHLKRIGVKTSAQCPCGEADQTPEHYLQSCSLHQQARQQIWPTCVSLKTKLWGSAEDLLLTSRYAALTGERI